MIKLKGGKSKYANVCIYEWIVEDQNYETTSIQKWLEETWKQVMGKCMCRVQGKETRRGGLSHFHANYVIYSTSLLCRDRLGHQQQPRIWEMEWIISTMNSP